MKLDQSTRLKAPLFALLISRYILRLGQAAQKLLRPRCSNPKMFLEIRWADERLLKLSALLHARMLSHQKDMANATQKLTTPSQKLKPYYIHSMNIFLQE